MSDPINIEDSGSDDGRLRFRYNFRRTPASPSPAKRGKLQSPKISGGSVSSYAVVKPQTPVGVAEVGAGNVPRRHPPSARVSAVREYPAGCGRNGSKDVMISGSKREEEGEVAKEVGEEKNLEGGEARRKIKLALSQFDKIYKKLSESCAQADMQALKHFNEKNKEMMMGTRHVGSVPGVEVGDKFDLRVEMCIVGVHRQHRMPVDYMYIDGKLIAVSVVFSRPYVEGDGGCDVFDYCSPGDLKSHTNVALKNCIETQTPVRVIHGFEGYRSSRSQDLKIKTRTKVTAYVYDGVFLVEKYRRKKGSDGVYVCAFQLKRMSGQADFDMKKIKTPKLIEDIDIDFDKHLIIKDISNGVEKIPIPVVNAINDEHPRPFKYTKVMIHPPQHSSPLPAGCGCTKGCSDSESCACAVKNGGELPFNDDGYIVEAKPLVYECGPYCKCPPSCHNRVLQKGIKIRLEVFKTEMRGWGVRSRDPIPQGSFICEYTGVLLDDKEADKNANDEYLFDIGDNLYDETLWEGLKTSLPDLKRDAPCEDDDVGFAVDALEYGNVGRFINHSCTPNLYAQNLLFDHNNKKMPHVALFAQDDIKPMEELTYDYNYAIERVLDSDGNIKKKECHCGSIECTGRMY